MEKCTVPRTIIIKFKKMKFDYVHLLQKCLNEQKIPSVKGSLKAWSDDLNRFGHIIDDWAVSLPILLEMFGPFPKITMRSVFRSYSIKEINDRIKHEQAEYDQDLLHYFRLILPLDADHGRILTKLKKIPIVEKAYLEGIVSPAAFEAPNDPMYACQGYLTAAPLGIDAPSAWNKQGGDGRGVQFVDIERGWKLNHEDLPPLCTTDPNRPFINDPAFATHGSSALGVVVAVKDNGKGIVGIAYNTGPVTLVSELESSDPPDPTCDPFPNVADAIFYAANMLNAGDVILLESQISIDGMSNIPVETDSATFSVIQQTTQVKNIIIIEAAGNGACNLDDVVDENGKLIFKKNDPGYVDSGAIMVGASVDTVPHTRTGFSNYGSRVDCYAWGKNICTCTDMPPYYTSDTDPRNPPFGGTSGAAAIIAGVALCIQGIAKNNGKLISPSNMRQILSDHRYGTVSANRAADQIGVMPDLNRIVRHPWVLP